MEFMFVCLGGAVGTGARYLLSVGMLKSLGNQLPLGTLAANLVGSFLMSFVMCLGLSSNLMPPSLRLVLTVGFLGGFTTYSSFNYETLGYFQNGEFAKGLAYATAMFVLCLVAGAAGLLLAKLSFTA